MTLPSGPGRAVSKPVATLRFSPHAVRIFVVLQDGNIHGRFAERLCRGHAVVAGNRRLQRQVVLDYHTDTGLTYGIAVVGNGITNVDGALRSGSGYQNPATGLADLGVEACVSSRLSVRIRMMSPSGSVSLAVASTAIWRPGRTLTSSSTGAGFWLSSPRGATPTVTVPVLTAPWRSITLYRNVSVPAPSPAATKSMKLLPAVAVPMVGVLSMPVSCTESPSGVYAVQRNRNPDAAARHNSCRQVLRLRTRILGTSSGRTWMVTAAALFCP